MKNHAWPVLAMALCLVLAAPAAAQKGKGILNQHGARTASIPVQIVVCLVHPATAAKDSGLDVEFMNVDHQGYVHVSDFKGDGTYTERPTADNPVFLFSSTMGSLGGGSLHLSMGDVVTVKTAPKTNGHTGFLTYSGGTFSWVCP